MAASSHKKLNHRKRYYRQLGNKKIIKKILKKDE